MAPFFSKSTFFLNNLNVLRGKLCELLEEKYLDKDKTYPDKDAKMLLLNILIAVARHFCLYMCKRGQP